jgi:hypothetical protein
MTTERSEMSSLSPALADRVAIVTGAGQGIGAALPGVWPGLAPRLW